MAVEPGITVLGKLEILWYIISAIPTRGQLTSIVLRNYLYYITANI
jgi:hypothetical protein